MEFYSPVEVLQLVNDVKNKPTAFSGRTYPVNYLGDREFEVLIYFLFKAEIGSGIYGDKYDAINLMKGVGERGRDLVLMKEGKNNGVVQCKKYTSLLTKPDLCREVIKFLLHLMQDSSLIDASYTSKVFDYYLVSVNGLNEAAQELASHFNAKILAEEKLKQWTEEVIESNESIKFKDYEDVKDELQQLLSHLKVNFLSGIDLDAKLKRNKDVVFIFFEIEKVVSETMVRNVLHEFNFSGINDEDIKQLISSLEAIPSDRRLLLGFINFYGFDMEFLRALWKADKFKKIIYSIVEVQAEIDRNFIDYLQEKVKTYHLVFFAGLNQIHPFTKQAVVPYLFAKYVLRYQRSVSGNRMAEMFEENNTERDFSVHAVNTWARIKAELLKSGERFLNKDFTAMVGSEEEIRIKLELMEFVHSGLNSVKEMSDRFDEDLKEIKPHLPLIEAELDKALPVNPTIIFETSKLLDDKEQLMKIIDQCDKLR